MSLKVQKFRLRIHCWFNEQTGFALCCCIAIPFRHRFVPLCLSGAVSSRRLVSGPSCSAIIGASLLLLLSSTRPSKVRHGTNVADFAYAVAVEKQPRSRQRLVVQQGYKDKIIICSVS